MELDMSDNFTTFPRETGSLAPDPKGEAPDPTGTPEPLTISVKTFCSVTALGKSSAYAAIQGKQVDSALIMGRRLITWASTKALIERHMAEGRR